MVAILSSTATAATAATVARFIGRIGARDYDALPAFLAPNATWWTAGNPALAGDAGGAEDARDHLAVLRFSADYDEYSVAIRGQVTEGRRAAVECRTVGRGPYDLYYVNNVSLAFWLGPDQRIELVHEYSDRLEIDWLLGWLDDHNISTAAATRT